jgi:hypothetical protein
VTGELCYHSPEVDYRFIVLAYNRHQSLNTCLTHLEHLELDPNITIAVEIFLDRSNITGKKFVVGIDKLLDI